MSRVTINQYQKNILLLRPVFVTLHPKNIPLFLLIIVEMMFLVFVVLLQRLLLMLFKDILCLKISAVG